MPREDFFGNRHRSGCGRDWRNLHLALQSCDVERKQPAIFNDLPGDLVFAARELFERDLFAIGDATDEIEVRRSQQDRKSTRLNSSHVSISYAVFCLKKKNKKKKNKQ